MILRLFLFSILISGFSQSFAQQFVDKGMIEYEVKTSIKKTMGTGMWAEMMKENMPDFKTGYYRLNFSNNKSVYKFHHWEESMKMPEFLRKSDEENIWFVDHGSNRIMMQKNVFGSNFYVDDSLLKIEWHLSNENRIIAGYNCRKAVGKIMDSVYVFAFYSDEITIPGGPCSISGLPGTILGLTIPRMYTSWIATKIEIEKADEAAIVPVKSKKFFTTKGLQANLKERTKEWFRDDDPDSKKWIEQFYWNTSL